MSIPTPKPLHVDFSPVLNCRGSNYIEGRGGEEGDTGHNVFKRVCGEGGGSHNQLELSVFKKSIIKWGVHNIMRGF